MNLNIKKIAENMSKKPKLERKLDGTWLFKEKVIKPTKEFEYKQPWSDLHGVWEANFITEEGDELMALYDENTNQVLGNVSIKRKGENRIRLLDMDNTHTHTH
ncbi:MAG: hypothetical protein MRECE_18c010 [Mycoplasmataceae bacterium CE_OT135]|nr:MAG: hypothetical protein MRECE_29c011 [Mycoplasmataceae bacterium CE_OT135]KLL03364.1 MAG: hypothetical protein MRECE_18c010 [Mycoplasmataceae bacterium CE_OT135]